VGSSSQCWPTARAAWRTNRPAGGFGGKSVALIKTASFELPVLLAALRRIGLAHTELARTTCDTIRLKLLKFGALVRFSARRIKIAMASAAANDLRLAGRRIQAAARASPA
jgi:hypothetical protein